MNKIFWLVICWLTVFSSQKVWAENDPGWEVKSTVVASEAVPEMAEAQQAVNNLKTEIENLNQAVADLSAQRCGLKDSAEELQKQVGSLELRAKELQVSVEALKIERVNREVEVARLEEQKESLRQEFDELEKKWQAISKREVIIAELRKGSYVEFDNNSSDKHFRVSGHNFSFRKPYDMTVHWVNKYTDQFAPYKFYIIKDGTRDRISEKNLYGAINSIVILSDDWFDEDKMSVGDYRVIIEYQESISGQNPVIYPVTVAYFNVARAAVEMVITAKIFTAWQLKKSGDSAFLFPAIATGFNFYTKSWVIPVRLIAGFGPDLMPVKETNDDDTTKEIAANQSRMNILLGLEVGLDKYLSLGPVWSMWGSGSQWGEKSQAIPFLVLSYGELYPVLAKKAVQR